PRKQFIEKLDAPRLVRLTVHGRKRQIQRRDSLRSKARIHGKHAEQAAAQQAGTDQKKKGGADLAGDEERTKVLVAHSTRLPLATFGKGFPDLHSRGTERAENPESHCDNGGQRHSKKEDGPVHTYVPQSRDVSRSEGDQGVHAPHRGENAEPSPKAC